MGSVAPPPRWRGSAIDDPIKAKTVELALHLGGGATMPGQSYGKADSVPPPTPNPRAPQNGLRGAPATVARQRHR